MTRGILKVMPSMISRPLAFRKTRRIAQRYLNGNVRGSASSCCSRCHVRSRSAWRRAAPAARFNEVNAA
jgi:hypothetical protein